MSNKSLPKPFGTYYYRTKSGWIGVVWAKPDGWQWCVQSPDDKIPRMAQYWPSKSVVMEMMLDSLEELAGTREVTIFNSIYTYHTFPAIRIQSSGSRWSWKCGKRAGIEKNKKLALEKASQYREDV